MEQALIDLLKRAGRERTHLCAMPGRTAAGRAGESMEVQAIKQVMVIGGAGIMGQGIVQTFAQAGMMVRLLDMNDAVLKQAVGQIEANLCLFQEYGLLKEEVQSVLARILPSLTEDMPKDVDSCDYVVETVPENIELKRSVFAKLDSCRPEIVLASNTSSCSVAALSEGRRTASRMIGIHYFNPAHIMPLVEIHYSPSTTQQTIDITKALMIRSGKKPVIVKKDIFGLLGTRIQLAMAREIESLLAQDVASPEDIDMVAKASYGFRHACIGNLEAYDMVGLETMVAVEKRIFGELSNAAGPNPVLTEKVDQGELGVKTGRGWFDYSTRSRKEVLESQNRRLLKQLALFNELHAG
jgi:3-hydroxyacyl-CoA dehydrogenase